MTLYTVMTDDGECIAVSGTRRDALMFILKRAREEYEVETIDEMLDEIDYCHSFNGMYVTECNNCQI